MRWDGCTGPDMAGRLAIPPGNAKRLSERLSLIIHFVVIVHTVIGFSNFDLFKGSLSLVTQMGG
jgi:hypothetical protein